MDANETKPTACAPDNSLDKTSPSASACEREPAASRGSQVDHRGEPRGAKGKIRARRTAVALFVIALMCFSLAFHSGIGTPSSFGIGTFQLICPLGGIEALLASKTAIPHAIISLVVVLAACLVVGRAWCAWGCPAGVVRKVFGRKEVHADHAACNRSLWETFKTDSRLWVLAGVLIATLVVGLPLFCLVCPIGLTFGTIMSIWRLIQFNDVNWGLLVFPAALVVEIVVCKAWCIKMCPIAGLLSLVGRLAKPASAHRADDMPGARREGLRKLLCSLPCGYQPSRGRCRGSTCRLHTLWCLQRRMSDGVHYVSASPNRW